MGLLVAKIHKTYDGTKLSKNSIYAHKQGTDTTLGTMTEDIDMGGNFIRNSPYPYEVKTAQYQLTSDDYQVNCTSGTFTILLPTVASAGTGKMYSIKNSGTGLITLNGNGAETIDSELTQPLNQFDNIVVISTATEWIII